jgi:uncharacterized membrane protein YbhN (UPF0104 family)
MAKFGRLRIIIQLIVGVAIILWLLQLADSRNVFATIFQVKPLNLIVAAIFFIIASTFVALGLYAPLRQFNPTVPVRKVIMASFAGQLLSDVTPVRSGYFLTPIFLNELANIPVEQGMTGVLATGGVNSIMKVLICLIGLGYFASFLPLDAGFINALIVGVSVLLIAGAFLLLLMWEKRLSRLIARFEGLPLIGKTLHKFAEMLNNVQEQGRKVKRSLISVAVLILLSVLGNATALYFIFDGLWHNSLLNLIDFFFLASVASALTYVPITIAGLGVQEAGYVILLSLLLKLPLVPPDPKLVAFALIVRALFTGTDIIGVGPLLRVGLKPKTS